MRRDGRASRRGRDTTAGAMPSLFRLLGASAVVIGIGPQVEGATTEVRIIAGIGVAMGSVLLVGSFSHRTRHGRILGTAAGASATALGLMIAILASTSMGDCPASGSPGGCFFLLFCVATAALCLSAFGIFATVVFRPRRVSRRRR